MTIAGRASYQFGEFLLDAGERRLSRAGEPIQLEPKTHDVLLALLRRAGSLVTKRELLAQVWPEAFVEEGILAVHVSALRRALHGSGAARYIETVPRSGYRFTAPVIERLSTRPPAVEVAELCHRGRAHLRAASMYEIPKALAAFRAAIVLDPTYAAAHAGLALACCARAQFRMAPFSDAYAEAKAAALRSLAMDPSCAAAQTALGAVLFFSEWDWLAAERSLLRAIDLDPERTDAYLLYGQLLEALGKLEAGLAMKRRALDLEPLSPLVHFALSFSYWNQRQYDESIGWANKTLELDPSHPHAREFLAGAYLKKGDFDGWLAVNLAHAQSHGVPAAALDPLKNAYAKGGAAGVAKLILERASGQPDVFPPMQLAIQYAESGDLDSAFQHLERANGHAYDNLGVVPIQLGAPGSRAGHACQVERGVEFHVGLIHRHFEERPAPLLGYSLDCGIRNRWKDQVRVAPSRFGHRFIWDGKGRPQKRLLPAGIAAHFANHISRALSPVLNQSSDKESGDGHGNGQRAHNQKFCSHRTHQVSFRR